MKKKILSFITLLCMVTALLPANITVFAATSGTCGDNLTWTLDDAGTLTISGTGDMGNQSPFKGNNSIKNVIIEEGVTSLCYGAFMQCSNITSVKLPSTLTQIDGYAFWWCNSLEHLEIPQNITYIGPAIGGGTGYLHFDVDENNSMYCDVDGVIFTKDMKKIVAYAKDFEQSQYQIPNGVTTIGDKAFANCYGLRNITFPDTISEIEQEAFRNCSKLQNIEIPPKVTRLEMQVFYACDFTSIKIHKNINYVGAGALAENNGLLIEVDPDNPNYCAVDGVLFNKDKTELVMFLNGSLQYSYTVPEGVTSIGDSAFGGCSGLTSITIPDSVTSIGEWTFSDCSSLTNVTIGNNVVNIGIGAFWDCNSITSITIPNSVTSIGELAFNGCSGLTNIYYTGTEDEWNNILIGEGNYYLTNANRTYITKPEKKTKTTISAGKTFTVTPINIKNGSTVILALYNGEKFVTMQSAVYSGKDIPFTVTDDYTTAKVMVWNNLDDMTPICEAEIVKYS